MTFLMARHFIGFFILSALLSSTTFAQHHLAAGSQLGYGYFMRNLDQEGDVLKTRSIGSLTNFGLSFQYRFKDRIGIEVGALVNRQGWKMKDEAFESRNPGFEVELKNVNLFNALFAALQYIQPFDDYNNVYFQTGFHYNLIGGQSLSEQREYVLANELITNTSRYAQNNMSVSPEIGYQYRDGYYNIWSVGLRYNHVLQDQTMMSADYVVTQNGTEQYSSTYSASGSYISLVAKFYLSVFYDPGRPKFRRLDQDKPEYEPVREDGILKGPQDKVQEVAKDSARIGEVKDRMYQITHSLTVSAATVTVEIWDDQKEDGDRVSINVNGEWVIEDYTLKKKRHEFEITLKEGDNDLVLHALNLGRYAPNTAAIRVFDGKEEYILVLTSDMRKSGALEINYKP